MNWTERGSGGPVLMIAALQKSQKVVSMQLERKLDLKDLQSCTELALHGIFFCVEGRGGRGEITGNGRQSLRLASCPFDLMYIFLVYFFFYLMQKLGFFFFVEAGGKDDIE